MYILVIALIVLGIVVAIVAKFSSGEDDAHVVTAENDCASCGGNNSRCMHDCMMEASVRDVVYYDDEELDIYAGRPEDRYTKAEVERFRDVLLTMRPEEVAGWSISLSRRGITPPEEIRDEMLLMME